MYRTVHSCSCWCPSIVILFHHLRIVARLSEILFGTEGVLLIIIIIFKTLMQEQSLQCSNRSQDYGSKLIDRKLHSIS